MGRKRHDVGGDCRFADQRDFRLAVDLIENGTTESLREARQVLERLIGKDSKFAPGYIELARVAMKTNWGPKACMRPRHCSTRH